MPQNQAEAADWFRKSAEQGHTGAQHHLARLYDNGLGVPQDHAEAARWYRRAAESGHADSSYRLGVMYAAGQGVDRDYVQAYLWLDLASLKLQGFDERDEALKLRDALSEKMTLAEKTKANRLAQNWIQQQHVRSGDD